MQRVKNLKAKEPTNQTKHIEAFKEIGRVEIKG